MEDILFIVHVSKAQALLLENNKEKAKAPTNICASAFFPNCHNSLQLGPPALVQLDDSGHALAVSWMHCGENTCYCFRAKEEVLKGELGDCQ